MKIIQTTWDKIFIPVIPKETNKLKEKLIVNPTLEYQTMLGFGGAFTDASASIYKTLSEDQKQEFINALLSEDGLNYSLARLTIGSCDFATKLYEYSSKTNLSDFNINYDKDEILPFLSDAFKIKPLTLFAAPWSPPKMYKSNKERCHGGRLLKRYYKKYAQYLVNYVEEMNKAGFNISYISVQNEPAAVQTWDSCIYTPKQEAEFALALHEELITRNYTNTKILLWDHNRDAILKREKGYYKVPNIDKAIDGFAYHWYDKGCSKNLSTLHELHKDKHIFFTEGCIELLSLNKDDPSSAIGSFASALRYGKNYLLDSLNYSEAFIDWNVLLNESGGPNHVGNYCEAPIMYNQQTKTLIYNPSYYVIKHFSNFVLPGAKRIYSTPLKTLLSVAFKNLDGSLVLIVINEKEEKSLCININNKKYKMTFPKNSITTLID